MDKVVELLLNSPMGLMSLFVILFMVGMGIFFAIVFTRK
ncbi:MAG: DUF3149 domain-containing protein [Gammaproteobacteria bacterium]